MTLRLKPRVYDGISLCFFGTFFPESRFAGNSSTGLVAVLALNERVDSLVIFSQVGSGLPRALDPSTLELRPCWVHGSPLSLLLTMSKMLKRSPPPDGFLFNSFVTAFGQSSVANGIGLLIPTIIALVSRKAVVVYMHNFLETQDVAQLGYRPTSLQRRGVRFLEWLLLRYTTVIVPLRSQQKKVNDTFRIAPRQILLPFIEPLGLMASTATPPRVNPISPDEPARILLLGTWGPQKDLPGVLKALRTAHERGGRFTVSITGAINTQFPQYQGEVSRAVASMDPRWFRFLGSVPEGELLETVLNHDLLILPYNATGGYSGAMSLGAYCGCGIIAYDLPQLREAAGELGIYPSFVKKDDADAIVNEILSFCANLRCFRESRLPVPRPEYDARACEAVERLVEILGSADDS